MSHPFPAEHDQQQAEALEILRHAKSFILINFSESDGGPCDNPDCAFDHEPHRTTSVIASCSSADLHRAMTSIGEEIMLTQSIELLMNLNDSQRNQIAGMLRHEEGYFMRLRDDDD
jgi:hypothetical protein